MHTKTNRFFSRLALISGCSLLPILYLSDSQASLPTTLLAFGNLIIFAAALVYGPVARWVTRLYQSSFFAEDASFLLRLHRDFAIKMLKMLGLWVSEEIGR